MTCSKITQVAGLQVKGLKLAPTVLLPHPIGPFVKRIFAFLLSMSRVPILEFPTFRLILLNANPWNNSCYSNTSRAPTYIET